MKTIALVDGLLGRQHVVHMRNYAEVLLGIGCRVVELLPDPLPVDHWIDERLPDRRDSLHCSAFTDEKIVSPVWRLREIYVPLVRWRRLRRAVRVAEQTTGWKVDVVFLCWLDDYLMDAMPRFRFLLPRVFPYRWSGVYYHPWHLRAPSGEDIARSQGSENVLKAKGCISVAVLDEKVADELAANTGRTVVPFPDETDDRLPAAEPDLVARIRQLAGGRKTIGLLGNMSKRKGVLSLLDVAEQCADRDWFFVFAGEFDEAVKNTFQPAELDRLERAAGKGLPNAFFHMDRIPDDRVFNAVIKACDALFAAYEMFAHSSGIVTKAAVFGKPILVSRGFCMEERVREYSMGLAVEAGDAREVTDALECVLDEAAFHARVGRPRFDECATAHSVEALKPAFKRIINLV
ncbi:glycosyltransferase [Verrucomicrobiota bacterium]